MDQSAVYRDKRISKDAFGNELSRISIKADQSAGFDSMEKADIESIDVRGNNTSIMRTEMSEQEHKDREVYKEMVDIRPGEIPPNRLA